MRQAGPIDVVEAAYDLDRPWDRWLGAVLDTALPLFPPCLGLAGYCMDSAALTIDNVVTTRGLGFRGDEVLGVIRTMPPDNLFRTHFRVRRFAATLSEQMADGAMSRPEFDGFIAQVRAKDPRPIGAGEVPPPPIRDFIGVLAFDGEQRMVVMSCALDHEAVLDRATRRRWTLVGVHLAAAARLRRGLEASRREPDAILSPTGRVEHAGGEAASLPVRQALRERVVAIDRARGRQRRSDPDGALQAWRGLVSGRWSLVDRFESDGRRYVVAHRNAPVPARLLKLTLRERQVVGHRLAGHSSKLTAYALGVSPAAVSAALCAAMLKLGVRNVAALLHRLDPSVARAAVPRCLP